MQIHEVTQPGILKTIGQDIKGATTAPFKKAAAVLDTPGAMTSPQAYAQAMNKYRAGQVAELEPRVQGMLAAQIDQKTQLRAKELAQDWTQLVKSKQPRARLKSAPTPIKPTGQYANKPTTSTTIDMQTGRPVTEPAQIKEQTTGAPTPAELAKFQQRVSDATPKTGFAAVAGPKPPPGGKVPYRVTAAPKNILTGSRAREFENWANQQLTSKIPGTNMTIGLEQVKKMPETRQALNTAITKVILSNNDPAAVEQYFLTAMRAMQAYSQQLKQTGAVQKTGATSNPLASGVLDRYVEPVAAQKLKDLARNPTYREILKKELGIT